MTDAEKLIYAAIQKLNKARARDPRFDPDIAVAVWALTEALRANRSTSTTRVHQSNEKEISKPKGDGAKPKPRKFDDFNGCHTHD
jgi:hypothetical protein